MQTPGHMQEGIALISGIPLGKLDLENQILGTEKGDQ